MVLARVNEGDALGVSLAQYRDRHEPSLTCKTSCANMHLCRVSLQGRVEACKRGRAGCKKSPWLGPEIALLCQGPAADAASAAVRGVATARLDSLQQNAGPQPSWPRAALHLFLGLCLPTVAHAFCSGIYPPERVTHLEDAEEYSNWQHVTLSYTVQCRLRCEGNDGCCPVRPQFSIKDARKGWLEACPVGSIAQSMQLRHPARKATDPSSTARRATQSRRAAVVAFCGWQNEKLLRCSAAERVTLRREETRMRGNSCVHFAHSKTAI